RRSPGSASTGSKKSSGSWNRSTASSPSCPRRFGRAGVNSHSPVVRCPLSVDRGRRSCQAPQRSPNFGPSCNGQTDNGPRPNETPGQNRPPLLPAHVPAEIIPPSSTGDFFGTPRGAVFPFLFVRTEKCHGRDDGSGSATPHQARQPSRREAPQGGPGAGGPLRPQGGDGVAGAQPRRPHQGYPQGRPRARPQ